MANESSIQAEIRIQASRKGIVLFRNNVGVLRDSRNIPVRYGLANDSAEMNKRIKSADLIGVEPVVITEDMVGKTFGRFISIEVKHEDWKYKGDSHERAQKAWRDLVNSLGGRALFATRLEDI